MKLLSLSYASVVITIGMTCVRGFYLMSTKLLHSMRKTQVLQQTVDPRVVQASEVIGNIINQEKVFYPLQILGNSTMIDEYPKAMGSGLIIDDPNGTMSHSFIDVNIEEVAETILKASKKPLGRKKPLVAILRGIGGGKTRLMEEIRREMLRQINVLPMAITFNSYWTESYTDSLAKTSQKEKVVYEISFRILASFYGIMPPDSNFERIFKKCFKEVTATNEPYVMLLAVIRHCILTTQGTFGKPIQNFVMMIDESMRLYELLHVVDKENDIYSTIRSSILGQIIVEGVSVALVMSSLKLDSLGVTPSGRPTIPIHLPSILNYEKVVDDWWLKGFNQSRITSSTLHTFRMMAKILGRLPRLVEYAGLYIQQELSNHIKANGIDEPFNVSGPFVAGWLKAVNESWYERYGTLNYPFPSKNVTSAIIFQTPLQQNEEILSLIEFSVLTNSLFNFLPAAKLLPEASLFGLYVAAKANENQNINRYMQSLIIDAFEGIIEILNSPKVYEGRLLEVIGANWLAIRIQSLYECEIQTTQLSTLLGIYDNDRGILDLVGKQEVLLSSFKMIDSDLIVPDPYLSVSNFTEFLNSYELKNGAMCLLTPANGSPYDLLFIYHDTSGTPRFVFLDFKSACEIPTSGTHRTNEELLKKPDQAIKVKEIVETIKKSGLATSSICKSLADGNYIYIYMSTRENRPKKFSSVRSIRDLRTIITYKEDIINFLGIAYDLYLPGRSSTSI